jgi:hypothetical protein
MVLDVWLWEGPGPVVAQSQPLSKALTGSAAAHLFDLLLKTV